MFKKKAPTTPPAQQADQPAVQPGRPQLGHEMQSLFAREINPPLANVDFGFSSPYGTQAPPDYSFDMGPAAPTSEAPAYDPTAAYEPPSTFEMSSAPSYEAAAPMFEMPNAPAFDPPPSYEAPSTFEMPAAPAFDPAASYAPPAFEMPASPEPMAGGFEMPTNPVFETPYEPAPTPAFDPMTYGASPEASTAPAFDPGFAGETFSPGNLEPMAFDAAPAVTPQAAYGSEMTFPDAYAAPDASMQDFNAQAAFHPFAPEETTHGPAPLSPEPQTSFSSDDAFPTDLYPSADFDHLTAPDLPRMPVASQFSPAYEEPQETAAQPMPSYDPLPQPEAEAPAQPQPKTPIFEPAQDVYFHEAPQEDNVVWGMPDPAFPEPTAEPFDPMAGFAPEYRNGFTPAAESPWQAGAPEMQPVQMSWDQPAAPMPMQNLDNATLSGDPDPGFGGLPYNNPVLSPTDAMAAQPVDQDFWNAMQSTTPGTPESAGQFLDNVSEQLYPADPFSSEMLTGPNASLNPNVLSDGVHDFDEAAQFLFPETVTAPLEWENISTNEFHALAQYEPPALELGPSYEIPATPSFTQPETQLPEPEPQPEPLPELELADPTLADTPSLLPSIDPFSVSEASPGQPALSSPEWEMSVYAPPETNPAAPTQPPFSETFAGTAGQVDPAQLEPWTPQQTTADTTFSFDDLTTPQPAADPTRWEQPSAHPYADETLDAFEVQQAAAASPSFDDFLNPPSSQPAAMSQPSPASSYDTLSSLDDEDAPTYSLEMPQPPASTELAEPVAPTMDFNFAMPETAQVQQPATPQQQQGWVDSWDPTPSVLTPVPEMAPVANAFAMPQANTTAMPKPDLNNPANWPLDRVEVLQSCQMDKDKHLYLVRHENAYGLLGQAGNPQNPATSVVKVFDRNPMDLDPTFGSSRQAGMGDQQMYVTQVGQWTAILSTLRDQIFLHTELG